MAEALVVEMGGEPEWIAEGDRPLYHAALAFGVELPRPRSSPRSADLLRAPG